VDYAPTREAHEHKREHERLENRGIGNVDGEVETTGATTEGWTGHKHRGEVRPGPGGR